MQSRQRTTLPNSGQPAPSSQKNAHGRGRALKLTAALLATAAAGFAITGCGSDEKPAKGTTTPADKRLKLTLTLDFAANAVHSGIFTAIQRGYTNTVGVDLKVRVPGSGTDVPGLLASGRTDLAILDIHDLAVLKAKGSDLKAIGAIVQRPLGSLIANPSVKRPRDLSGKTVGVTGLPSDDAVVDQIVKGDGGKPKSVKRVTIGFNAVQSLLSGKTAAATGFWNAEGVAYLAKKPKAKIFKIDDFGAPSFPELLVVASPTTLNKHSVKISALLNAVASGYETVASTYEGDSERIIEELKKGSGDKTIDPQTTEQQLAAVAPAFVNQDENALQINRSAMGEWSAWEKSSGLSKKAPNVDQMIWSDAP